MKTKKAPEQSAAVLAKPLDQLSASEAAQAIEALRQREAEAIREAEQSVLAEISEFAAKLVREKLGALKPIALRINADVEPPVYEAAWAPAERRSRTVQPNGGKPTIAKVAASLGGFEAVIIGDQSYATPAEACKALGLTCWENDKPKGDGAGVVIVKHAVDHPGTVQIQTKSGIVPLETAVENWKAASKAVSSS